ncbi:MAG: hypothetical protein ACI9K3_001154, partial [Halovenus sp.]
PGEGEVTILLDGTSEEGDEVEYEVLVADAEEGIGAYEFNVSVEDPSLAGILGYELTAEQTGGDGPFDGSQITDDGETLAFEVALGEAAHPANETDGTAFTIATFTVEFTGGADASTNLTTTSVEAGQAVATPEVGQGEMGDADFYDVLNLGDTTAVPPAQTEIDLAVEPDSLQSPPESVQTYDVVAYNATDGFSAYDLSVEIGDPAVAQFVDIAESLSPVDSNSGILDESGSPADAGPVARLNATVGESPEGSDRTVIAELSVEATGDISETTAVNVTPGLDLRDNGDNAYLVGDIEGSQYTVTADMGLSLRDQFYGDGPGVTVRDVDSDDQQGTVLVTYEDGNETVVAGLATGVWDSENVQVTIEDLGGLTGSGDGPLAGEHTAHIGLTDQLSSEYEPGDTLSEQTATTLIDAETATVTEPPVPDLTGFTIDITDGLTIGDDYPLNQRRMFETAGGLYGLSGRSLGPEAGDADQRYAPVADGRHVGLGGLPVQDEVYEWAAPLVGFQSLAPTQAVAVSFDGSESSPVTFNFSDARAHGLQVAEVLTVASENVGPAAYDWTLDNEAGEIVVTFDEAAVGPESPTIWFELVWEAADPVEGLRVDAAGGIDYETDHRLVAPDADQVRDNFVTFEAGATGISHADTDNDNNGFIGESADEVPLDSFIDSPGAADGTANDGSFLVWQGQTVTLETAQRDNTIDIFEVTTDEDGAYALGAPVDEAVIGVDDTAPGRVANLDTSTLTAGQQYFVTFAGTLDEAVVLDVRPLGLSADSADTAGFADRNRPFEVNVTSQDTTGGDVEAWFLKEELGSGVGDVVHVERDELTGEGDRQLEVVPSVDLAGPGTYTAIVLHGESGVTARTEFTVEAEPTSTLVPATDVTIVSPSLQDPDQPGLFDRGDIVPVELELEGGNVGTVTFGDAGDQNVEVHATVFDPTYDQADVEASADTTVTVYLNTYQIGHGYVADGSGGLEPNRPDWIAPGDWENRQHGFFTNPEDNGSGLVAASDLDREHNVYASTGMDIYGGSQGGAVISPGELADGSYPGLRYDFHATSSFQPHTAPGVQRDDVNALDIEQRATTGFTIYTAPGEGENAFGALDPTTVDDFETLKEQGIVSELEVETVQTAEGTELVYNGTVAENDYFVIEADSSGLEGVMHEAVVRNSTLDVAGFLNRTGDHLVTDAFRAATDETLPRTGESLLSYSLQVFENTETYADRIGEPVENVEQFEPEQVVLDLEDQMDRVLSGVDADGNLQQYVIPYQLEPGDELLDETIVDTDLATLEGGLSFDTPVGLAPSGGEQAGVDDANVPTTVNPALDNGSLGIRDLLRLDYVTPAVSVDDRHLGPAGLELPGVSNYTLTGTSTMAPGTRLDVRMLSLTNESTPLLRELTGIETVAQPGDQPARWSVSVDLSETRDDVAIQSGTEFTTDITRTAPSTGIEGGADIPGVVLPDPAVETFVVTEQRSDGDAVAVEAFDANRVAQIEVYEAGADPASDEPLGTSEVLDRGLHEQFNVVLDEPISSNQNITAVATIVRPETGDVLDERTAEILVEDETEAFFSVGDLDPQSVTGEPGDPVDVSVTVENLGDLEATQDIVLEVSGLGEVGSESLTLAGGDSDTVSFTVD